MIRSLPEGSQASLDRDPTDEKENQCVLSLILVVSSRTYCLGCSFQNRPVDSGYHSRDKVRVEVNLSHLHLPRLQNTDPQTH